MNCMISFLLHVNPANKKMLGSGGADGGNSFLVLVDNNALLRFREEWVKLH